MANQPTADDLVKVALLAMLHDQTGLTGSIEPVAHADWDYHTHLESCPEATVTGPARCEQDCTSTGTGMEVITAEIGCPHGEPIMLQTGGYGIGSLLDKMIKIGRQVEDEREWGDNDD